MILEIIPPHLSNFYAIYSLLAVYDAGLSDPYEQSLIIKKSQIDRS
jgi:hypothetical protein